jgi:hypothetical protein
LKLSLDTDNIETVVEIYSDGDSDVTEITDNSVINHVVDDLKSGEDLSLNEVFWKRSMVSYHSINAEDVVNHFNSNSPKIEALKFISGKSACVKGTAENKLTTSGVLHSKMLLFRLVYSSES